MHRGFTGLVALLAMVVIVSAAVHAQRVEPRVDRVESDMKALVAASSLSEEELEGRRLFIQRCAFCHEQRGSINVGADRVALLGDARVRNAINEGLDRQMPGFQHTLDETQVDHIITFLKTVTSN